MKTLIKKKPKGWRNITVNGKLYWWKADRYCDVYAINPETRKRFKLTTMWNGWTHYDIEKSRDNMFLHITPKVVAYSINQDEPLTT